jgi:hypothetical protein
MCPQVGDKGSLLDGRFLGYNTKAQFWIIVGNMFGECHKSCMSKTSFVDFEKKKQAQFEATTED